MFQLFNIAAQNIINIHYEKPQGSDIMVGILSRYTIKSPRGGDIMVGYTLKAFPVQPALPSPSGEGPGVR